MHISLFLFIFCNPLFNGLTKTDQPIPCSIKQICKIGGIENEIIYQWAGICVDDSSTIFLTDLMDCSVKKIKDGKLIKTTGRRGQGPGEFQQPVKIQIHNNMIYINDIYSSGVHVFNKDLEFCEKRWGKHYFQNFIPIEGGSAIITGMPINGGKGILQYVDKQDSIYKKIIYCDETDMYYTYIAFTLDAENNIIIIFKFKDCVMKISQQGEVLWSQQIFKGKKTKLDKQFNNIKLPSKHYFKSVILDKYDNIYILGGSYSKKQSRDIYVLSSAGEYKAVLTLDEKSHMLYIDENNYLYTRADDGAGVSKYLINYK
ncbi:hypothetical protein KAR48_18730 [bacterium]|nr:hypothetical protein [bacterium]